MDTTLQKIPELKITESTDYEKLMTRIQKNRSINVTSIDYQKIQRGVIKEIVSVYFYLRERGLGYEPITIEEFEVIQKHLLDLARRKTRSTYSKLFSFRWRYFLKNKFFRVKYCPAEVPMENNWYKSHPFHYYDFDYFDVEKIWTHVRIHDNNLSLPPNLRELSEEIIRKRYQS